MKTFFEKESRASEARSDWLPEAARAALAEKLDGRAEGLVQALVSRLLPHYPIQNPPSLSGGGNRDWTRVFKEMKQAGIHPMTTLSHFSITSRPASDL